jgi:nuclease S1
VAKTVAAVLLLLVAIVPQRAVSWGPQGHRLVALVAAANLTPAAKRNVASLIGPESLADVAIWADAYLIGVNQTSYWHYVNIPPDAKSYDRDRDCPRQPGVAVGARGDVWRDCVVDRIRYNEERLADVTLDRADRAIALKFLVHFVGDLHQPLHASAVERGGNGILVRVFGAEACGGDAARPVPCNLHAVWDTHLIAHRGLNDREYLALLDQQVRQRGLLKTAIGEPAAWAMESLMLANGAMLPQKANIDEAYYRAHIAEVDGRLALGGVRLAALINRSVGSRR